MAPTEGRRAAQPLLLVQDVLARSIKAQREKANLSQEDLAERMRSVGFDWKRETVAQIEGARRRQVSIVELLGLSSVYGVPVLDLLWPPDLRARLQWAPGFGVQRRGQLVHFLVGLPQGKAQQLPEAVELLADARVADRIVDVTDSYTAMIARFADQVRDSAMGLESEADDLKWASRTRRLQQNEKAQTSEGTDKA